MARWRTLLYVAEHDHQSLKAATRNAIAAAQKIGGDIHVLVAGTACSGAAQQAATVRLSRALRRRATPVRCLA